MYHFENSKFPNDINDVPLCTTSKSHFPGVDKKYSSETPSSVRSRKGVSEEERLPFSTEHHSPVFLVATSKTSNLGPFIEDIFELNLSQSPPSVGNIFRDQGTSFSVSVS
jgi:hypothetical protein